MIYHKAVLQELDTLTALEREPYDIGIYFLKGRTLDGSMKIQSFDFDPEVYTHEAATSWLESHGYDVFRFEMAIRSTSRRPIFDGTETISWAGVDKTFGAFARGVGSDAERVEDLTQSQKTRIAAHSLLGNAQADTFDDLIFFPVVNPSTGKLNAGGLRGVLSGRGAQAKIPQSAKDSAQNMARSLLREHFQDEDD